MKNLFFLVMITLLFSNISLTQEVRPIRDNVGFCWTANEMNQVMHYLSNNNDFEPIFDSENLIAGISPHDDYLYAGNIYYPLYKQIKAKEVIVFGVTHGTVRKAMDDTQNVLILDEFDLWQGPFGKVEISPFREYLKLNLNKEYFMVSNKAQTIEHSIEALIPFLQYYNRDVKITPIMVTVMPYERIEEIATSLSEIIFNYIKENNLELGKDIFFLISNDANHYGEDFNNADFGTDEEAHLTATNIDQRIADESFNNKISEKSIFKTAEYLLPSLNEKEYTPLWCGRFPIIFGLKTILKTIKKLNAGNLEGELFKYSDTFTEKVLPIKNTTLGTTAPFSLKHWVGFLSAGFYIQ